MSNSETIHRARVAADLEACGEVLRAEEAAQVLRLSVDTAEGLIERGELPTIRLGRLTLVTKCGLQKLVSGEAALPFPETPLPDSNLISATALRSGSNGRPAPPLRLVDARRTSGLLTAPGNKSGPEVTADGGNANAPVSNSPAPALVARVEAWAVQNGANLAQPLGKSTLRTMAEHAGASEADTLAAIEHLRQERGVTVSLMHAAEAAAESADPFDVEPADCDHLNAGVEVADNVADHSGGSNEVIPATCTTDPQALAMLLVNELRAVDGPSRPAALIEAARLLRRTL